MSNFHWATLYVHVSEVMQTERDAGPDFFRLICTNINGCIRLRCDTVARAGIIRQN